MISKPASSAAPVHRIAQRGIASDAVNRSGHQNREFSEAHAATPIEAVDSGTVTGLSQWLSLAGLE
jgi:hypothetical protein